MSRDYIGPNIRDHYILGQFIGRTIIDVTEADEDEKEKYVMLMFSDGSALKFPVTEAGFGLINAEVPEGY